MDSGSGTKLVNYRAVSRISQNIDLSPNHLKKGNMDDSVGSRLGQRLLG
jgi:hypothetical protein